MLAAASRALRFLRAGKIANPTLRQSFLERIQVNREVVQAYKVVMRDT